jgi:cytoskeletal protein CcmA (bactofilin family)
VFKRRKHDDSQVAEPDASPAAAVTTDSFGDSQLGNVGATGSPNGPAGRFGSLAGSPDTGLGVPPFRPAPLKEAPNMARTPFATNPTSPSLPARDLQPTPTPPAGPRPASLPARPPVRDPSERRTLVVGRGISVQGTVQDAERLVVEGTVEASMIHATELAISHGGVFKGEVQVEDAEIAGVIDGTLTARNSLLVRASGRVLGTARCKRLQVEDGGQITGKIEMITESGTAPKPEPARVPEPVG